MMVEGLVLLSVSLGVVSIASIAFVVKGVGQRLQAITAKEKRLDQQIKSLTTGAIGMGHRILALEEKLNSLPVCDDLAIDGDSFAYTQAKQMFDQGADTETVASNCGFSSSEAELIALVQKSIKQVPSTV